MTIALRTLDELRSVHGFATLSALSASIDAFMAALGVSHPDLLDSPTGPRSPREGAAVLLLMFTSTTSSPSTGPAGTSQTKRMTLSSSRSTRRTTSPSDRPEPEDRLEP
jgi:hypothetical protein